MDNHTRSKFGLLFVFSISILLLIVFNLSMTYIITILLMKLEVFSSSFYQNPTLIFIYIVAMSIIMGLLTTTISSKILLKPIREVLSSIKKLANGNFNVRINMNGLLHPKELIDFSNEFNQMAEELGSIEMLRTDFVNNFSHEFKTPIVSLRGFAKLLKDDNLYETKRNEYLDIIIDESDRLAAMSTNILLLSKIKNQTIVSDKTTFNLSEQLRRSILMLERKWMEKGLKLEIDIEEINFYGNTELLNQVWINVLDNAIKFSAKNEKIQIKLMDFYDSIVIIVRDYGSGMDKNTQEHIFDKFYRGDTKEAEKGNGIGMSLVRKIIKLHHGEINIESKLGKGTKVTIALPKNKEIA